MTTQTTQTTQLLTDPIKLEKFNDAVNLLKEIDIDGETAEFLLMEINMLDQVKKQIITKYINYVLRNKHSQKKC